MSAIRQGRRRVIIHCVTGAGKTTIAAELAKRAQERGKRVWFLVHREELCQQAVARLTGQGCRVGWMMGTKRSTDEGAYVQVIGIDTVRSRVGSGGWLPMRPDVTITDEAHHATSAGWSNTLGHLGAGHTGHGVHLFLSATPWDEKGRGLGIADAIVSGPTPRELVALGVLVPPRIYCGPTPDLSGIKVKGTDFDEAMLAVAMGKLVGDVVDTWKTKAQGRRTLCFAVNVAHSIDLVTRFLESGIRAAHVDANTPDTKRKELFTSFRDGGLDLLSNVGIATEGVDIPSADCILLARATKSDRLFLQMVGRGLRSSPGKKDCILLDHGYNALRHGHPLAERPVFLTGSPKRKKVNEQTIVEDATDFRLCQRCMHANSPKSPSCESCGAMLKELPAAIEEDGAKELGEHDIQKLVASTPDAVSERRRFFMYEVARTLEKKKPLTADAHRRGIWQAAYAYGRKFGIMPLDDSTLKPHERKLYFGRRG